MARYHKDPERYKAANRERLYGLSYEDYQELLKTQGGVCAICREPEKIPGRALAVDHDHRDNRIRGLLCNRCNNTLGRVDDSPELLEKMAAYLHGGHPGRVSRAEALAIAHVMMERFGPDFKSVHVQPMGTGGKLKMTVFLRPSVSKDIPEPEAFIFGVDDLVPGKIRSGHTPE